MLGVIKFTLHEYAIYTLTWEVEFTTKLTLYVYIVEIINCDNLSTICTFIYTGIPTGNNNFIVVYLNSIYCFSVGLGQ